MRLARLKSTRPTSGAKITLEQREQLTHALELERQQRAATGLAAYQQYMAGRQQRQQQPAIVYPNRTTYDIYDQSGSQVGTLKQR